VQFYRFLQTPPSNTSNDNGLNDSYYQDNGLNDSDYQDKRVLWDADIHSLDVTIGNTSSMIESNDSGK